MMNSDNPPVQITPRDAPTPTVFRAAGNNTAWQKLMLGAVFAGALMAVPGEASADNKVCYWNAEGLPYSKAPPPDAGEPAFSGGPLYALAVMHIGAPQLMFKSACGVIDDADLVRPRKFYRQWGCSPDSSMAQMIEGLASGGVFVSELMSFLEYASEKYAEGFAELCPLLKGIDPICYRTTGDFPNAAEKFPQCVESWPKLKAFGEFFIEIRERERTIAQQLTKQDRALIESAGVE